MNNCEARRLRRAALRMSPGAVPGELLTDELLTH